MKCCLLIGLKNAFNPFFKIIKFKAKRVWSDMNRKLWDKVKFGVNSRPQQQHLNLKELTDKTPEVLPWENRKETMVGQSIHFPFWQDIILSGFTISPYPRWRKARNSTNTYRSFSSTRQFLSKESFLWRWLRQNFRTFQF